MKNKIGISLVALTITIIVMAMLATVVVVNTNNSTEDAMRAAFADELTTILQASNEYYLNNGVYPITNTYTREQVLEFATSEENKAKLQNEMALNKDYDTVYYEINLSLIKMSGGGLTEGGKYIINSNATDIYYAKGFEIEEKLYFSLSSRLIDVNKINSNTENSLNDLVVNNITEPISFTKNTKEFTNDLVITVNIILGVNEKIYYTVGEVETEITDTMPYDIVLSKDTITDEQLDKLKTDKNVYLTKKTNDVAISKRSVDVSNLDIVVPVFLSEPTVISYSNNNVVKFITNVQDESGIVASYYTTDLTLDKENIISSGTRVEEFYINLAKNISKINMVVVDKAGNISEIVSVTIPDEYVM